MTAAGGIVIRNGRRPLFAVVQRRKDDCWVLPKGKLKRGEKPAAGAKREAVEETGQNVRLHEFLGAVASQAGGRQKVTSFWRMQVARGPRRELAGDIRAVVWLPLSSAIEKLSLPVERSFLDHVGSHALKLTRTGKTPRKHRAARTGKKQASPRKAARVATKSRKTKVSPRVRLQTSERRRSRGIETAAPSANNAGVARRGQKNILRQFWGKLRHSAAIT
ncbi:MAG: NUDIX hydrolase [Xanthobacteraceae bacterium]|uniref:NUDIX hydrolase n=1 Tax=Pseudolabrys sp. TaxID=1960880 RepID=UPI003D12729D